MKRLVKQLLLPTGERPYRIRGGALKGSRFYINLQHDTQVWRGIYEQALQSWLVEHVHETAVCFDVGAAEGWATLLMAKLARRGKVFAFEPSERGDWVEKNLQINSSDPLAAVTISRAFVSDHSETTDEGGQFVSLDDFSVEQQLDRIDIVKIDVDGPENDVLDGAKQILSQFRPAICVEAHSRELQKGVVDRLHALGYKTHTVDPPPHERRPLEYNPMVFGEPACP